MRNLPLHDAILAQDEHLVERLLASDLGLATVADCEGQTPLHLAISEPMAMQLLTAGADPNARDRYGNTPLFNCKDRQIANILIENGANVNSERSDGWTPLLAAIYSGNGPVVAFLIARGANRSHKTLDGTNALNLVCEEGNVDMLQSLLQFPDIRELINRGNIDGLTPLHLACLEGETGIARILLQQGASSGLRSNIGVTPLELAVEGSNPEIAQLLIRASQETDKNQGKMCP